MSKIKSIKNISSTDWPPRYVFGLALQQKLFDILKIFSEFTNIEIEIYLEEVISIKKLKKIMKFLHPKIKNFMGTKF